MLKALRTQVISSKIRSKLSSAGIVIAKGSKADSAIRTTASVAAENWNTVVPLVNQGKKIAEDLTAKGKAAMDAFNNKK